MGRLAVAAAAVGGVIVAALTATVVAARFTTLDDTALMKLAVTLVSTGLGGLVVGAAALWASRGMNLGARLVVVTALGLLLFLANTAVAGALMFIASEDMRMLLILCAFALAATAVPAVLMGRGLTTRLRTLEVAAETLATGALETRVHVGGGDDIARLADAFNHMAAELQDAGERREQMEAARRELFAAISHDLRTPLSSIQLMVEAMSDGVVTDAATTARYLGTMSGDIERLSLLIDDLFELARIDGGALELRREPLEIEEVIAGAVDAILPVAEKARVAVRFQRGSVGLPVEVDPARLTRVLANLLQNALRHTPPDGTVMVSAAMAGGEVVVSVADTGEGIQSADLPHVFERFYRGEKSRSRAAGGSGLGLSISRGIVEAHGGRIWVAESSAAGTVVRFALPAG